jgi:hypothetical protein
VEAQRRNDRRGRSIGLADFNRSSYGLALD